MPGPVSETLTLTELGWERAWRRRSCEISAVLTLRRSHIYGSACNQTVPPAGVNFEAFSRRFETIRSILGASKANSCSLSLAKKYRARPRSWKRGDHKRQTSERQALMFPGSNLILS